MTSLASHLFLIGCFYFLKKTFRDYGMLSSISKPTVEKFKIEALVLSLPDFASAF